MPKVSVILPVYNGQEFLEVTISTLCNSTMRDIEIIVVDDGSKDNSYEIIRMYAEKDSRIRAFRKKNEGGVYASRNYGIQKANGEYICFCDQDDVVEIDMFEKMYQKTQNGKIDIVMCSTGKLINGKKENYEDLPDIILDNHEQITELLLGNLFINTNLYTGNGFFVENTIWKCMINNRFIKQNNIVFRRYVNYEDDWLFVLDVLARAGNIVTMSDVLYYWKINLMSETYNSKYVENMYEKNIILQSEIENIARIAGIGEEIIALYHKHYNCFRYINMLENEQKRDGVKVKDKISRIKVIKEERDFYESLLMRKYYKRKLIRKVVALSLLNVDQIGMAYLFLVLFRKIKLIGIRNHLWTRLEKKLG